MIVRDKILCKANVCYKLAGKYRNTLGLYDTLKNHPALCNKVTATETLLSQAQLDLQKLCKVAHIEGEPDLFNVIPNSGTIVLFIHCRSICAQFNVDWTNSMFYVRIIAARSGRSIAWITKLERNRWIIAALSEPGFVGAQHIFAAGFYIGTCLEIRDKALDPCLTIAVDATQAGKKLAQTKRSGAGSLRLKGAQIKKAKNKGRSVAKKIGGRAPVRSKIVRAKK